MTKKQQIIVISILVFAAFATGRWLAPTKVVTQVKTVEVEKKTDTIDKNKDTHKQTTTTTVTKPDGTTQTQTTTTEDTKSSTQRTDTTTDTKETDKTKTVERSTDKVTLQALAGLKVSTNPFVPTVVYGGMISKPILGPCTVGLWGLSDLTLGASVGLTF